MRYFENIGKNIILLIYINHNKEIRYQEIMEKIVDKVKNFEDISIRIVLFELYKSFLLLISDKEEMGLGEITLATPNLIKGLKSRSFSQKFVGTNDSNLSNIIAEKVSYQLKNPTLVLLFLNKDLKIPDLVKPLITFLNDCISDDLIKTV